MRLYRVVMGVVMGSGAAAALNNWGVKGREGGRTRRTKRRMKMMIAGLVDDDAVVPLFLLSLPPRWWWAGGRMRRWWGMRMARWWCSLAVVVGTAGGNDGDDHNGGMGEKGRVNRREIGGGAKNELMFCINDDEVEIKKQRLILSKFVARLPELCVSPFRFVRVFPLSQCFAFFSLLPIILQYACTFFFVRSSYTCLPPSLTPSLLL